MKSLKSYSVLGNMFEYLNQDCGYEQWSQYLLTILKSYQVGDHGMDVGCGNGTFTRAFAKAGYTMIGVDISTEMLSTARTLAAKEGVFAEFLYGDITKLKTTSKLDFIVAINDCLNYVEPKKVLSAFKHVSTCLKKGGMFLFDISSENKLKNILGENLFGEDTDDVTYLWFNHQEDNKIVMDLTFFLRREDGTYERRDEQHIQYAHNEQTLCDLLEQAGFEVCKTEGHLGGDKSQRIQFICKKL